MIEETIVHIGELEERWVAEREVRYARRNKIRYIDELLNDFEMLNLAEEEEIPLELLGRVSTFVRTEGHPLGTRPLGDVPILDWMEALYDVQDTLMIPFDDEMD